jgi:fumarylacetoacetase
MPLNSTHDPARRSWIESANSVHTDFPLQNLPYGVFTTTGNVIPRLGVAIGDSILDLRAAAKAGLLPDNVAAACQEPSLNALMSLGKDAWSALRARLSELLDADTCPPDGFRTKVETCLLPQRDATMRLPAQIGGYTDFYASIHHATRVGAMFRPENPLLPNYRWVPIGYHGRTSSIVVSGTPVRRPRGQTKAPGAAAPAFGPSTQLDYELELGAFVGPGNPLGEAIPLARAADRLFGVVLLNDWSARDIQSWEYQPLGPFLAKNFATSISPWVVTLEALAPFRVPAAPRAPGEPAPLPYLTDAGDSAHGGFDLSLEVWLRTEKMRATGAAPVRLSHGNFRTMHWTLAQLLAHHTSNGCNLRPGDLLGSGTVSGPEPDSAGCLLELTARGMKPLKLPKGETHAFLTDGDEVVLRGYAERDGVRRVGLGECRGIILPAADLSCNS